MHYLFDALQIKPKNIFLIDGVGALVTALIIYFILNPYNEYIGVPSEVLMPLSLVAFVFCVYSISCFFLVKHYWQPFLTIIIAANSLYCLTTIGVLLYYQKTVTALGLVYFVGEIIVIGTLVLVEMKLLRR
jgi:hypothetical protein